MALKNQAHKNFYWSKELKNVAMASLCAGLVLSTTLFPQPAFAISKNQSEIAEKNYEKALISFHDGEIQKSKIHLKNALKENARHLPSRILMAEILIKEGNGAGAEVELNFARERGADYNRLIVLFGQSYILQGKNKYLLDVIHNGNRDSSIEAEISFLRGQAYFGQKKLANAKRSYQKSLDMNPLSDKAKLGLAQVAAVHKRYDRALMYIDSVIDSSANNENAWILKAKIFKLRGFNQDALNAINAALDINQGNVLSRLTRAALYVDIKKFEEAEKDVDYILNKIPREPRARYIKAVVTAAKGDYSASNANMTEIINVLRSLPPETMRANPTYYYLSGLTNLQYGNLDEARDSLQKYLKLERADISAMRLLGALELQAGDPIAANVVLTEAYRSQPENPTILTMLGMVYLQLGNVDKANYYLERVTALLPDSSEGLANLARGRMAAGSFDQAIANLLKAEKHNLKAIDIKLLLSKAYQQSNQYDKSVQIIENLLSNDPENPELLNLYGTAVGLTGDHKKARKSYEKALQNDENNVISLIHLSRMDVLEGKSDKAISSLRTQLEKSPTDFRIMLELGNTYKLLKDNENTLFWYKKAYSINSNDFAILSFLIDGYLINDDIKAAISTTLEYSDNFPRSAAAYTQLGILYQRAGSPVESIKNYKLAAEYSIQRGEALLDLATAQLKNNNTKAATKTLQKAVAWDPELTEAYISLINISIREKNSDTGFNLVKHLRTITEETNPAADILSGDLHMALGDFKQAEKSYKLALKIGDNPIALMGLYKAYMKSGRMNKAVRTLENWTKKYPEDIRSALSLGNAYKRNGQIKKSVTFHDELLTRFPNMPIILNNAASVNFMVGNEDKALDYAQKANAALPDNANILDTLAWIETRRGNPDIALPLLRKALVLRFSNPEIKYHLAITLDKLGRRGEAQKLLAEAVASRTDFTDKKTAIITLKDWQGK